MNLEAAKRFAAYDGRYLHNESAPHVIYYVMPVYGAGLCLFYAEDGTQVKEYDGGDSLEQEGWKTLRQHDKFDVVWHERGPAEAVNFRKGNEPPQFEEGE
jgi:hypothetical protein